MVDPIHNNHDVEGMVEVSILRDKTSAPPPRVCPACM